jgi:HD-GYP domain-containing protein (c-di-GMP phosphodiesterase class II)
MSDGPITEVAAHDRELAEEFMAEFQDACSGIEETLQALEQAPADRAWLDDLFRRVHSVKSNLRMLELEVPSALVHSLEHALDDMRQGALGFDGRFSDLVVDVMERVRLMATESFAGRCPEPGAAADLEAALADIRAGSSDSGAVADQRAAQATPGPGPASDLEFFLQLASLVEDRSPFWQGRSERILELAGAMNQAAGNTVDPLQLRAAVYVHDIGMAFLPLELLHKPDHLDAAERESMQIHSVLAAELLGRMNGWEEAVRMVREHHEREDGTGYPGALAGSAIGDGAKIIAIADAFESMTHQRADRVEKKPLLQAVSEINRCAGSQFCARWVAVFNQVIRDKRVRKAHE